MAEHVDVLMKIVTGGQAMTAEGATQFVRSSDTLRDGFTTGSIFELRSFSFAVGSSEALQEQNQKRRQEEFEAAKDEDDRKRLADEIKQAAGRDKSDFIDIQPVGYTRIFDQASPILFGLLVASTTLDSISVIKRKAAGTRNAGAVFLRVDFTKALLTDMTWTDGEERVMETGTFLYRELTIRYRPQNSDGTLGPIIPGTWKLAK